MSDQKAAILLSRQSMHPSGSTPWIINTCKALKWIKENNYILISSVGMQTWEMISAIASDLDITQEIYIPCINEYDFNIQKNIIIQQFELDKYKSQLFPIFPKLNHSHLHLRDEIVLGRAEILIPVSIRPGGFMMAYLQANKNKQNIIEIYRTDYHERSEPVKYNINTNNFNPLLNKIDNVHLTHWTRTANSNWPDETKISFWHNIVTSPEYPGTALNTLKHILSTGKIIASKRHMPVGVKAVSFTSLPVIEAISLMRWRARYREMSFEPYGIAIDKDWGIENGIFEVKYYDSKLKQKPSLQDLWRSQSTGKKTDWQQESEFRYKNNFNLDFVPKDKIMAICYKPDEIKIIETDFGIKTISVLSY